MNKAECHFGAVSSAEAINENMIMNLTSYEPVHGMVK